MTYLQLAYLHLGTVLPAFVIGTALLATRKGTPRHRRWGRVYLVLMLATALISLAMPAEVGPQVLGHFGFIHIFSVVVLVSLPLAVRAARRRDIHAHRRHMQGVYVGGLLVAGAFALMPGRLIHTWWWG